MNEEKWLKSRIKGIGGSDAPIILGLSSFMNAHELWEIKTEKKKKDFVTNDRIEFGKALETPIAEIFRARHPALKVECKPWDTVRAKENDFIMGTLDGRIFDGDRKGFLEVKTCQIMNRSQMQEWENQIPSKYFAQICHYFLCDEEFEFAHVSALLTFGERAEIKDCYFEREKVTESLDYLLEKEKIFWHSVQTKQPPKVVINF